MQKFNPGEIAPRTGDYNVVESDGTVLDTVSVAQGNRFPPTQSSDYHYEFKCC